MPAAVGRFFQASAAALTKLLSLARALLKPDSLETARLIQGDSIYIGCLEGEIGLVHGKKAEPVLSRVTPDKDPSPVMAHLSSGGPAMVSRQPN